MKCFPFVLGILESLCVYLVSAIPKAEFYPFGTNHGDTLLPKMDDGASPAVPIRSLFPFFNSTHDKLYVNTNGVISFQRSFSDSTPSSFPRTDDRNIIAPFWADVKTSNGGDIWYRESNDSELLKRATQEIQLYFTSRIHFQATWIFIATWDNVLFYGASRFSLGKGNTFQAVLFTSGKHSFAIFNYANITWTTGTASGGNDFGLGGTPAQVGFNAGDGINYNVVNQALTADIIQLPHLSNVDIPGKFVFRLENATLEKGECNTGGTLTITPRYIPMFGGKLITLSGPCIDSNDTVKISFDSGTPNLCVRRSTFQVQCSTPIFYKTGDINVNVTVSFADQEIHVFRGIITLLNPIRTTLDLIRINPKNWKKYNRVQLHLDTQRIPFDVNNASLEVWSVKTNENPNFDNGMPQLEFHKTINSTDDLPLKSFDVDFDATSVVLRMSATSQEGLIEAVWSDVFFVPPPTLSLNTELCNSWQQIDDGLLDVSQQNVQDCPCIVDQAAVDLVRFHEDPICHTLTDDVRDNINCAFHPEAKQCFHLNAPGPQNTGRICCYNEDGSLMDVRWRNGGGSLHRRHYLGGPNNVPYLSHFLSDVAPYLECCIHGDSNTCQQFLQRRPQGKCENYRPVTFGRTSGDPHFTTLDGLSYTFNGVGEFVLLTTTDKSFIVQVRMEQAKDEQGNLKQAAVITSFVAKSHNISDTVEIQLHAIRGADVLVNGHQIDFTETNVQELKEVTITSSSINGSDGSLKKFDVVFKQPSIAFMVLVYPLLLNTFIASRADNLKDNMAGLLGNYNGNPSDDLQAQNGTLIQGNSTIIHREFGLTWRVSEADSLFTYPIGKSYSSYQDHDFTPNFVLLPASTEARQTCGDDTFCLFDYQVTGDKNIAISTREATRLFQGFIQKAKEVISCGLPVAKDYGSWNYTGMTVNSTAVFACHEGPSPSAMNNITCMADGNWTESNATCKVLPCGQPSAVKHGTWMTTGLVYNSTGTLKCYEGYITNASGTIHCFSNGSWSVLEAKCSLKSCGFPLSIENGSWNVTGITVNSTSVLVCDEGFKNSKVDQITCMVEGNWTETNVTCEAVSCGQPNAMMHGTWITTGLVYNSTGTLKCDAGYTTNTSATIHCLSNGSWSASNTKCSVKSCGTPASIENGSWNVTGMTVNFTASMTCNKGFTPSIIDELACMSNGNWSDSTVTCEAVSCGQPAVVKHGSWMTTGLVYNSTGTLKCDEGYTTNTTGAIHCLSNGSWSAPNTQCFVKSCGFPVFIEKGSWNVTGEIVNSTAILTCDEGFTPSSKGQITCMADGNWTESNVTCEAVSCGKPSVVKHGTWMTTGLTYNSTSTFKCDEGYTTNTTGAIHCLSNGSWSAPNTQCFVKSCGFPVFIEKGSWNVTGETVNSTAILTCDEGFTPSSKGQITCMADGNWTESNVTCEAVSCGKPSVVKHGTWMTTGLTYNSTSTFKCDEGYTTNTTGAINCLSNGSWSAPNTQCFVKSCGFPVFIGKGSWNVTGETVNSTAILTCDEGFTPSSKGQIICMADGNWTDSNVTCEVADCGIPNNVLRGSWSFTTTTFESLAMLNCSDGYHLSGNSIFTCLASGQWNVTEAACENEDKQRVIFALIASGVSVACVIMGMVVGIISVKILKILERVNMVKANRQVQKSNSYRWRRGYYRRDAIFLPR